MPLPGQADPVLIEQLCEDVAMVTWEMPAPDPARGGRCARGGRSVRRTPVTVGRIGRDWYVEHTQIRGWHGQICDTE
ncbi:hypothetical protein [Phytomonospora endophytica]|uniref:Uncharacterized protein n=1 Tax=Phytomonospora endophytica TaxID=714109 RepID=A0A841G2Y7_9ACTN|nr:hypothetical protein [Phytomonospora endophytica]MBB6039997.1 hypothetical protein [Phytomonospora endophytica]